MASESSPARTRPVLPEWLAPRPGEEASTILAVLPWLGIPVLVSAALAARGKPLLGEALPVVAFLPLVLVVYVLALRVPSNSRALAFGMPGLLVLLALLAFVGHSPPDGAARTIVIAVAASLACSAAAWMVGRWFRPASALATPMALAMVVSQGLDGWLTYLAIGNPFGWLEHPATERVFLSRVLLEAAPALYPLLKLALGLGIAFALLRRPIAPRPLVAAVLAVCYVGLSPAMFSAAHLLAST